VLDCVRGGGSPECGVVTDSDLASGMSLLALYRERKGASRVGSKVSLTRPCLSSRSPLPRVCYNMIYLGGGKREQF
jgi:hypothetical protein